MPAEGVFPDDALMPPLEHGFPSFTNTGTATLRGELTLFNWTKQETHNYQFNIVRIDLNKLYVFL